MNSLNNDTLNYSNPFNKIKTFQEFEEKQKQMIFEKETKLENKKREILFQEREEFTEKIKEIIIKMLTTSEIIKSSPDVIRGLPDYSYEYEQIYKCGFNYVILCSLDKSYNLRCFDKKYELEKYKLDLIEELNILLKPKLWQISDITMKKKTNYDIILNQFKPI